MSLIPEKQLTVSPSLATTLGLEEAILLPVLAEITSYKTPLQHSGTTPWHHISFQQLHYLLPFWQAHEIQRVLTSLKDKGVLQISSAPITESQELVFALETSARNKQNASAGISSATRSTVTPASPAAGAKSANLIHHQWQPCDDTLRQLSQYNIPHAFIEHQIPEFVSYWSERGEPHYSWSSKFIKRVLKAWRDQQQDTAKEGQKTRMHSDWRPSQDALEILIHQSSINPNFCEDAIPEFVLYWRERGELSTTWNSRFISHVKRQWQRYTSTMDLDSEPRPIAANWQPSEALFDVLTLANIPRSFAEQQIAEFVLYWQESGHIVSSWNSKFLQHIKRQWAQQSHLQQDRDHEKNKGNQRHQHPGQSVSTRHRSLEEDLTDRSWAG